MAGSYRIGEVAEATGLPPSTLRYYEDNGLLPPPARSDAGQRVYDDAHIERLRFMALGKRLGLTLEEIGRLADAWDGHPCEDTREELIDLLEAKLHQVHGEIRELTQFVEQLRAVVADLTARNPSDRCGPGCCCAAVLAEPGACTPPERRFGELPLTTP